MTEHQSYFQQYGRIRLAPMMGYTTPQMRKLMRLICPNALNYTEMITVNAILYNPQPHYFTMAEGEGPTALQLGGCEADAIRKVARSAEMAGFSEINLNVGCPSNRVRKGRFGACLMQEPQTVAALVEALKQKTTLPITVKHRIGLNGDDDYAQLVQFVRQLVDAGCDGIIVHNRCAYLNGISPRMNRKVPPLKPFYAHQLKRDFSHLNVCTNGEIDSLEKTQKYLTGWDGLPPVDGVMIGRAAWVNPWLLYVIENQKQPSLSLRLEVLKQYLKYVTSTATDRNVIPFIRPLNGFFAGMRGAKHWRQLMAQSRHKHDIDTIWQTADALQNTHAEVV